jgi:hypothetical protein
MHLTHVYVSSPTSLRDYVLTAVTLTITGFEDVTSCSPVDVRNVKEKCYLHSIQMGAACFSLTLVNTYKNTRRHIKWQ